MQHHSQTDVQVGTMNFLNECTVLFKAFMLANSDFTHILTATTSIPTSLPWLLGYIYMYVKLR